MSIERLEDVALEYESGAADLEQLKHSLNTDKVYSDSDSAVWRTLGNWSRLYASGASTTGLRLFLITNGELAENSAISLLGADREPADTDAALAGLLATARASTNVQTAKDRADFQALIPPVRKAMLTAATVIADAPSLAALGDEIEEAIGFVCTLEELPRFRNELEGWWFDRVMTQWTKGLGATIQLLDLDARISFLRERYKESTLTIDVEEQDALEPLDGRMFVRQVKALDVGPARIRNVQRDFLKCGAQRSKWIREFKVDPEELNAYDRALTDRWERKSAILRDELPQSADGGAKCMWGRSLLGWAEEQEVPIKTARAQFLTSGSYHALADELKVGWHPDFKELFKDG